MDWLRRNWPDLLIGVALVAVIAGIIATLISGGSFFPVGQGDRAGSTPPPVTAPSATPLTPDGAQQGGVITGAQQPEGVQPADGAGATQGADGPGVAVLPPAGTQEPEPAATAPQPEQPVTTGTSDVTVLPPAGTDATPQAPAAQPQPPAAATPSPAPSPAPEPQASAQQPAAPSASATSEQASYRVSVGAFGNADNAQRLAQQFQGAGFPVLLGTQGNLTIVLVGPYATEAEARRVADQVRAGNFGVADPTVYLYDPQGDAADGTTAATPAPAAATPAPAAAPSTGRYLQVGAYANRESSLPQRQLLESKGFTVAEVQEGSYVKLLVGPYQGDALSEAQRRLATEGIENFARTL